MGQKGECFQAPSSIGQPGLKGDQGLPGQSGTEIAFQ